MKTSLFAFGFSILFTQYVDAQLYATGEINGLYLKPNGYNEESAFLPGAIFSFGYYEFMSNYDVYLNAGIGLPKLTHYTSTIFGETSFVDPVNIDEIVNWYTLGIGGTYWYGSDLWDSFMIGGTGGGELIFQAIEQKGVHNGDDLTYDYSGKSLNFIGGMKLLYLPTDVLGVQFDAMYKISFAGFTQYFSYSGVNPSMATGYYFRLGLLYYFE